MLRIGHFAHDLWAQGGVATYIRRVGAAQEALGHQVHYFGDPARSTEAWHDHYRAVSDVHALFAQAEALGLDVLHLHKPIRELPPTRVPLIRTVHGNGSACPSARRYLARTNQPCPRIFSLPACLWGHLVDGCGSRRPRRILNNMRGTLRERRLIPQMLTYTVSQYLYDQMVRTGYETERLHVLPSPAPEVSEPALPMPADEPPRFVFLGRLVPQKGLAWLLHAFARLQVMAHLDIAGDGYQLPDMHQLATSLGLDDRVTFHGWIDGDGVRRLIEQARAVVFPSIWHEPAGLVSLEAAAYGRPVIASRVGGIPEYALDDFAVLVEPNDVAGLARQLTAFAMDRDRAARMGARGAEIARDRFSMDRFLQRLFDLYEQAMAAHQPSLTTPQP